MLVPHSELLCLKSARMTWTTKHDSRLGTPYTHIYCQEVSIQYIFMSASTDKHISMYLDLKQLTQHIHKDLCIFCDSIETYCIYTFITCSLFTTVSDSRFRPDTIVSSTYYMYHIPVLVFVQLK